MVFFPEKLMTRIISALMRLINAKENNYILNLENKGCNYSDRFTNEPMKPLFCSMEVSWSTFLPLCLMFDSDCVLSFHRLFLVYVAWVSYAISATIKYSNFPFGSILQILEVSSFGENLTGHLHSRCCSLRLRSSVILTTVPAARHGRQIGSVR